VEGLSSHYRPTLYVKYTAISYDSDLYISQSIYTRAHVYRPQSHQVSWLVATHPHIPHQARGPSTTPIGPSLRPSSSWKCVYRLYTFDVYTVQLACRQGRELINTSPRITERAPPVEKVAFLTYVIKETIERDRDRGVR